MLLSVLMIVGMLATPAFATNEADIQAEASARQLLYDADKATPSKAVVNTVVEDLRMLETAHLNLFVSISEVHEDGTVVYEIPFEEANVTDYVTVSKEGNDIVLDFTEGEKHNVVVYKEDGRVFIDGFEVIAESSDITAAETEAPKSNVIARVGMKPSSRTYSLPNGDSSIPSNFSKTNKSYATNRITFGTYLKDISYGAIISGLSAVVVGGLKGLVSGLSANAVGVALDSALWYIKNATVLMLQRHTTSTMMSFSAVKYVNKNNDTLHAEWLYSMKVYGLPDYGEPPTTVGVLECLDAT